MQQNWLKPLLIVTVTIASSLALSPTRSQPLLVNTILLAAMTGLISLPMGVVVAIFLFRTNCGGRRLLLYTLMAMLFVPPYLQVAGWNAGFGMQGWFPRLFFSNPAAAPLDGWRGAIWIHSVVALPWVILIVGMGLRMIPRELEEQALLNASGWQVIRSITLPSALPSILAAAMWILVSTATEITVTDVYQIRTFAEEIFMGFSLGDQLVDAQLRAVPGTLLVAGLSAAALLVGSNVASAYRMHGIQPEWTMRLGPWKWLVTAGVFLLVLFLIGVPVGNLIYKAGIEVTRSDDQFLRSWSPVKLVRIVASSPVRYADEFAWSFGLCQLTSITVLVSAFLWAWLARNRPWIATIAVCLSVIGLAVPGPLIALAIGRAVNHPDSEMLIYIYDRTLFVPWLALFIRCFPFAYMIAVVSINRLDDDMLEMSLTDGAGAYSQFRYIALPQLVRPIAGAWIVALAVSLSDLSTSVLAVPPGVTTLSIRIFNLVHYGVEDQLAGLCLSVALVFAVIAGLAMVLLTGGRGNGTPADV